MAQKKKSTTKKRDPGAVIGAFHRGRHTRARAPSIQSKCASNPWFSGGVMYRFAFTGCPSTSSSAREIPHTPRHLRCKRLITREKPPRLNAWRASGRDTTLFSSTSCLRVPAELSGSGRELLWERLLEEEEEEEEVADGGSAAVQNSPSAGTKTRLMMFQSLLNGAEKKNSYKLVKFLCKTMFSTVSNTSNKKSKPLRDILCCVKEVLLRASVSVRVRC